MRDFTSIVHDHTALARRRQEASIRLADVRDAFSEDALFKKREDITVYCAGSLARGDVGSKSDLDLFLLSRLDCNRLDRYEILARAIAINRALGFPDFSNDGKYLEVYSSERMLESVGAPQDDHENTFTARMLLILESQSVLNSGIYEDILKRVVRYYFRDSRGKESFRPLFLLNDVLRYWRTLCLNYELIRDDRTRPWRKKNINLKFSRMLTVFGTVLPVVAKPIGRADDILELLRMPPLERMAHGLDVVGDVSLMGEFQRFLDDYEQFIVWKEKLDEDPKRGEGIDSATRTTAASFSGFLYKVLNHQHIDHDFRKYLVL